jgi:hypothetical protein
MIGTIMDKIEFLTNAILARTNEIAMYQIEIDSISHIINNIGNDSTMQDYKTHMEKMLIDNQKEQRKAELYKNALEAQLPNTQT